MKPVDNLLALRRLPEPQFTTPEQRRMFARDFNRALDDLGIDPGADFLLASEKVFENREQYRAGSCLYCGEPVDRSNGDRQVIGWERKRAQGGANAIRCRTETHVWAHSACVDRESKGINVGQQALA